MKKGMKSMVVGSLTAAMLASAAGAADFTASADALKNLGLFQGSQSGYELDRAPDRAEAATMLVRLLGKEEEAKAFYQANVSKFPFTDMDGTYDWAKPYVAWLFDQQLTSGASATTFEPGNPCTAQQYTTFLMRALGYSDGQGGDFTYDNVVEFATNKGVIDPIYIDTQNFLRDDVVAMSYTALSVSPKSGQTDLLTKLVDEKAISAEKAAPVQKQFEALRNFNQAYQKIAMTTSADATADFTMNLKIDNEALNASGKFDIQVKADPKNLASMAMAMKGSLSIGVPDGTGKVVNVDLPMEMYVKDGIAYNNTMGIKVKENMNLDAIMGVDIQSMMGMSTVPLCMVNSISQDGNTYKMSYNTDVFNGLFAELFAQMTSQVQLTEDMKAQGITEDMLKMSLDLSKADIEMTLKEGGLYDQKANMAMSMDLGGQKMEATIQMNMTANQVGDSVKVSYPSDLDSYPDASQIQQ